MGIFFKSWRIATRNRRRFFGFVIAYAILALSIATSLKQYFGTRIPGVEIGNYVLLLVTVGGGILLSTMYGLILTTFRKKEIATLKAIGWSNGDVRSRILGEIIFLSLVGFLLLLELDIHLLGLSYYLPWSDPVLNVLTDSFQFTRAEIYWTFLIIILLQLPGVLIANNRALQVKPMIAMQAL